MKKFFLMGVALCSVMAITSCKSSESAYKKAYEKAQMAQQYQQQTPTYASDGYTQPQQNTVAVTPVQTQTQTTTTTTTAPAVDYSNLNARIENVELVSGNALKTYSVVVGSFSVKANAEGLCKKLGSNARVVKAKVNGADWFRVVAGSFDTKNEAGAFRATLTSYPDAWLLYNKK